ncbi:MAG: hypothetical protein AUJ55_02160 [Proteobacteria bacterium CG1_02_64_396]|nr:MAG: hypothetical protein AUJ55_02160 [Proteobacteria bacterium CG1_02_64_396]
MDAVTIPTDLKKGLLLLAVLVGIEASLGSWIPGKLEIGDEQALSQSAWVLGVRCIDLLVIRWIWGGWPVGTGDWRLALRRIAPWVFGLGWLGIAVIGVGLTFNLRDIPTYLPEVSGLGWVLFLPLAVLVGPWVEELLFRGALQPALAQVLGGRWAVVVTALVFAAAHLPTQEVPLIPLIGGLLLGWVMLRAGHVMAPFVLHAGANAGLMLAGFLLFD